MIQIDETTDYLVGSRNTTSVFSPLKYKLTSFKLEAGPAQSYYETDYYLNASGIFMFNVTTLKRSQEQRLRVLFSQGEESRVELVYNSKHGLLVNGDYIYKDLGNVTKLFFVLDANDTMFFVFDELSFANVFYLT